MPSLFSNHSGGVSVAGQSLTAAGAAATPWTASLTMTGEGLIKLTGPYDASGVFPDAVLPYTHDGSAYSPVLFFLTGGWFTLTVLNHSGSTWTGFKIELQSIFGTPSDDFDDLSFAQTASPPYTVTSDKFTTVVREDVTEDSRTFSGGSVANNDTVTFVFPVTDNAGDKPIWFHLTPTPNGGGANTGYGNKAY